MLQQLVLHFTTGHKLYIRKSETPICRVVDRSSDMSLFAFRFDILLICVIPLVVDEAASFLVILVDWGSRKDSNRI